MPGYRSLMENSLRVLYLIAGWTWFGASGAAMVGLWLLARPRVTAPRTDGMRWLQQEDVDFVHVTSYAVVIASRRDGRTWVFRDEVSRREWVRLRRACLNPSLSEGAAAGSLPAA